MHFTRFSPTIISNALGMHIKFPIVSEEHPMKNKLNRLVGISSTLPAKSGIALVLALGIGQAAFASGGGIVTDAAESLTGVAKARIETYSPYAERDFPDRVIVSRRFF